jgi:hypothetical protein
MTKLICVKQLVIPRCTTTIIPGQAAVYYVGAGYQNKDKASEKRERKVFQKGQKPITLMHLASNHTQAEM